MLHFTDAQLVRIGDRLEQERIEQLRRDLAQQGVHAEREEIATLTSQARQRGFDEPLAEQSFLSCMLRLRSLGVDTEQVLRLMDRTEADRDTLILALQALTQRFVAHAAGATP